ncbi:TIGR03086 family metal-binding protein (plasmid) [Streptomyces sp. NBC_01136]|uniref:TIGR03086 family metal-binding protein n=1 Tax=unclassified Streptomyces TaxID=2593676 RepID=UPI002F915510|nr:TIGR03086 family metal-binding protein [Streptomyces sp. NBC_01136]
MPSTRAELLTQSIDLVVDAVNGAPVDQYQNPTPCSEFTVKDLVNHIAMMLLMTRDIGTRTAEDLSLLTANPVPFLAGRPESAWAQLLAGKAEPAAKAWSEPTAWEGEASLGGPPMAATALGEILIAEFTIHAWDTAVATGQPVNVPTSLAKAAFDTYTREAPRMRGLGLLTDEVPQETHAPLFDRALALTGRDPRWSRPAHERRKARR